MLIYKTCFGDPDYPIKDDRHDLVLQDIYVELVDDTFDYLCGEWIITTYA